MATHMAPYNGGKGGKTIENFIGVSHFSLCFRTMLSTMLSGYDVWDKQFFQT
jgi:hypothetical protein